MNRRIAVVNTGTSTLKLALMEVGSKGIRELHRVEHSWNPAEDPIGHLRATLVDFGGTPDAFGHRVVHGGTEFVLPTTLTARVEAELEALVPLAPLHNGPALAAIRAVRKLCPNTPAIAVFDTAFHAQRPAHSVQYALRPELAETFGIRRYGFHGIAHASLVEALANAQGVPVEQVSAVTLQLGAGCSACAAKEGQSVETSMGFTPLEGLMMATRSGDVDPAVVLRLMRAGYGADRIEEELTRRSGFFGLCGLTDMREILAAVSNEHEAAGLALRLFCHRIILTTGAYFTLLDGQGALVFGGGVGRNAPQIRERVTRGLAAWGVALDKERNQRNQPGLISSKGSRAVFVFDTNEEAVIAREVQQHIGS